MCRYILHVLCVDFSMYYEQTLACRVMALPFVLAATAFHGMASARGGVKR